MSPVVIWLKYCRYGVKHYPINQSTVVSEHLLHNEVSHPFTNRDDEMVTGSIPLTARMGLIRVKSLCEGILMVVCLRFQAKEALLTFCLPLRDKQGVTN